MRYAATIFLSLLRSTWETCVLVGFNRNLEVDRNVVTGRELSLRCEMYR